jgi:hypothetical protein
VRDQQGAHPPGWCTYTYEHEQAPELEVLCGGVNSKSARAGAIWRQGHLLHFGFEPSPEEMTEAGKAMLINAICYIARFTEDRPIVHTPCVFVQGKRIFDRGAISRLLANPERDIKDLQFYLEKDLYSKLAGKSREELDAWCRSMSGYLHAGASGNLTVDPDAQAFGVPPASLLFLDQAIAALHEPDRRALALRLLHRYAPEGPAKRDSVEGWRPWWEENKPYLFFSDTGGYRWYIDPLAKKKAVPTKELQGSARASLPAVRTGNQER